MRCFQSYFSCRYLRILKAENRVRQKPTLNTFSIFSNGDSHAIDKGVMLANLLKTLVIR